MQGLFRQPQEEKIDPAVLAVIQANVAAQIAPYQPNPITGEIPAEHPVDAAISDAAEVLAGPPPGSGSTTSTSAEWVYAKVIAAPAGGGATVTFDGTNNVPSVAYVGTAPVVGDQVLVLRKPPVLVILGKVRF